MKIRDAVPEDATVACEVMRRSIAELCVADHRNDPTILERWLGNKTPEIFKSWIRAGNALLVAIEDERILAVGCVTDAGEITLNYVSRTRGFAVSAECCWPLSKTARERGNERCTLKSTETARRFYLERGCSEQGPADGKFGTTSGYPMSKHLVAGRS